MELIYGEALYFLDEVEYKEEYKEGDKIKIYILKKRDNQPWLDQIELEYIEKGNKWLKGEVFRKEFSDGWIQFDLKESKLKIITKKEWVALNEPLGCPDKEKEKEKKEIKYDEEYIIEGERYILKKRGGPKFEKFSSKNSQPSSQTSEKDINDLKNKNSEQEKTINDLKNKNDEQEKTISDLKNKNTEQEKAINDLKSQNNEQEKTLEKQGKQIEELQKQLAQVMQMIQKGMLPT